MRPSAATAGGATSEHFSETEAEEVVEDLVEIDSGGRIEAAHAAGDPGVSEAIVGGALIGVAEDGVSFGAFLEFFFCVGIVGIAIGMVLERELAVGALDLLLGRSAGDAQHLVVIAFHVRRNRSAPRR